MVKKGTSIFRIQWLYKCITWLSIFLVFYWDSGICLTATRICIVS